MRIAFFLNDVDIDDILVSNRISSGEKKHKYFLGYIDTYKMKPFSIILPKTSAYIKSYDSGTNGCIF